MYGDVRLALLAKKQSEGAASGERGRVRNKRAEHRFADFNWINRFVTDGQAIVLTTQRTTD